MRNNLLLMVAGVSMFALMSACGTSVEQRLEDGDLIGDFVNGYAKCYHEGKSFYIDENGKQVSRAYDRIEEFQNGYSFAYMLGGNYVVIDTLMNETQTNITELLDSVRPNGTVWVKGGGLKGLYDLRKFEYIYWTDCYLKDVNKEGYALLLKENGDTPDGTRKTYLPFVVGPDGKEVIPLGKYQFIGLLRNGRAAFSQDVTWQRPYANPEGIKLVSNLSGFNDPKTTYGYIDYDGNVVIPSQFPSGPTFNEQGLAVMEDILGRVMYKVDLNGSIIR